MALNLKVNQHKLSINCSMKTNTCNCLGYDIFSDNLNTLPIDTNEKALINTINQYSYCIAEEDPAFKEALSHSDILLPDGIGIVAAAKFLKGADIHKISGADLHQHMLEDLNRTGGTVFYLGSCDSTLAKIKNKLEKEFPFIKAHFFSPPYKQEFSEEESEEMISRVNEAHPDVLFVGMTAPKQEKWSYHFKEKLNTKYICSIGAVFDFYAGTVKRPGKIWINMGLEWLGRLLSEPKRLYKRYLIYGPVFVSKLVQQKMHPQPVPIIQPVVQPVLAQKDSWDVAA
jgi:N-acetylglucosaminyldiphosphoundecaprenol N-acetyl-beta-D-mannosaminyltransferase